MSLHDQREIDLFDFTNNSFLFPQPRQVPDITKEDTEDFFIGQRLDLLSPLPVHQFGGIKKSKSFGMLELISGRAGMNRMGDKTGQNTTELPSTSESKKSLISLKTLFTPRSFSFPRRSTKKSNASESLSAQLSVVNTPRRSPTNSNPLPSTISPLSSFGCASSATTPRSPRSPTSCYSSESKSPSPPRFWSRRGSDDTLVDEEIEDLKDDGIIDGGEGGILRRSRKQSFTDFMNLIKFDFNGSLVQDSSERKKEVQEQESLLPPVSIESSFISPTVPSTKLKNIPSSINSLPMQPASNYKHYSKSNSESNRSTTSTSSVVRSPAFSTFPPPPMRAIRSLLPPPRPRKSSRRISNIPRDIVVAPRRIVSDATWATISPRYPSNYKDLNPRSHSRRNSLNLHPVTRPKSVLSSRNGVERKLASRNSILEV